MIIECIGTTSAGKTTLLNAIQSQLTQSHDVTTAYDVVAERLGRISLSHPTARNVLQDIMAWPYVFLALPRYGKFLAFTLGVLKRRRDHLFYSLNYWRSIIRKVGTYEIIRRHGKGRIVFVDEGTLLAAHNLFVYTDKYFSSEDIERFSRQVPLPDLVIYMKAAVPVLLQRTLQRSDPPRELRSRDPKLIEKMTKQGNDVFEKLVRTPALADRTLVVGDCSMRDQGIVVATLEREIRERLADCKSKDDSPPSARIAGERASSSPSRKS